MDAPDRLGSLSAVFEDDREGFADLRWPFVRSKLFELPVFCRRTTGDISWELLRRFDELEEDEVVGRRSTCEVATGDTIGLQNTH